MTVELSIIVPAFNEAPRLADGFKRLDAAIAEGAIDFDRTELLFVDDGSTDQTADTARMLLAGLPHHRVVSHPGNRGKGAAVRTGVTLATAPHVAYMDADFAIDPRAVPRLLAGLRTHDVVIGSRALADSMVESTYALRSVMGRLFNRLVTTGTGLGLHDTQCGFKAFRTPVARLLFQLVRIDRFAFDVEILALAHRLGLGIAEVPVAWTHVPGSTIHPLHDSLTMLRDVYGSRLGLGPTPMVTTLVVSRRDGTGGGGDGEDEPFGTRVTSVVARALGSTPVPIVASGSSVVVLLPLIEPHGVATALSALRSEFGTASVSRRGATIADLQRLGRLSGRV